MKDISDVTAVIVTSGLYQPLAQCIATKAKRTLIWSPDDRAFPSVRQDCMGDGFEGIERVREFWPMLKDIDLFCFPDVGLSGLQNHLESIGKAVWGSRRGDELELRREWFLSVLREVGLEVPEHHVCQGMDELRAYLRDREDQYIKISRFRGDMETRHWRSWEMDEGWLDWLAYTLGPTKDVLRFLVFERIETDLEIGADTYCIDGRWPSLMLNGFEFKDTTYFAAVTKREEMPEQIQEILEAFSAMLTLNTLRGDGPANGYRNQISFEDRVKGDKHYFIDATQRGGMPSSGTQQLIWKNFPEIIWAGANGELLDPEPAFNFSLECMVTAESDEGGWIKVDLDPELMPWMRFSDCALINGIYCFPPEETHSGELGWLVALGDTPTETLERAKELADLLPDGCDAKLENLVGLIKEVEEGEKQGIPFTEEPIPEPAEVVAD